LNRRQLLHAGLGIAGATFVGCSTSSTPHAEPSTVQVDDAIAALLEANRSFDVQFGGGLSNHLSMAVVALHRLGASDARLREFFDAYSKRLEPTPHATSPITSATFAGSLGTQKRYADHLAFLTGELRRLGRGPLLATYLPRLLPGISAAAFHAVIRLAYGLQATDDAEVAVSLAYLADAHLPLGTPTGAVPIDEPPTELLRRVAAAPTLAHRRWRSGQITNAFTDIAAEPSFAPIIDWLPASTSLAALAEAALLIYASTDNFTALHGLTSTHALRIAWPYLSDPAAAVRYQFQALAAAYVSIGTPPLLSDAEARRLAQPDLPSWAQIAAAAMRSPDEHVIKLVYSAGEEEAAYHGPLYQYVAAKKAGLIG
jgi:hypothetical protein